MARRRRGLRRLGDFWQDNPEVSVILAVIVVIASWAVYSYAADSPRSSSGGTSQAIGDALPNPTATATTTRTVKRNGKLVTETVRAFATVTDGETLLVRSTTVATGPGSTRTATETSLSTVTATAPGPTTTETVAVPGPTETVTVPVPGPTETVTVTVTVSLPPLPVLG